MKKQPKDEIILVGSISGIKVLGSGIKVEFNVDDADLNLLASMKRDERIVNMRIETMNTNLDDFEEEEEEE